MSIYVATKSKSVKLISGVANRCFKRDAANLYKNSFIKDCSKVNTNTLLMNNIFNESYNNCNKYNNIECNSNNNRKCINSVKKQTLLGSLGKLAGALPFIEAKIGGRICKLLIDSGSSSSVLSSSFINNKHTCEILHDVNFIAVNGSNISIYAKQYFDVSISDVNFSHLFYIADIDFCIIGADFFRKNDVDIMFSSGNLNYKGKCLCFFVANNEFIQDTNQLQVFQGIKPKRVLVKTQIVRTAVGEDQAKSRKTQAIQTEKEMLIIQIVLCIMTT